MDATYKVISIGAFQEHPLWKGAQQAKTPHATTTLIVTGDARILIDPSLPAQVLGARLQERANIDPARVTHVFLTSFEPFRRRAIHAFDNAQWLISERERETVGVAMVNQLREAMEGGDDELVSILKQEVAILERCQAAPDSIAEQVDLFPLYGVTPGTCGVLIANTKATILVCGDAVASQEHLDEGKVLPGAADIEQAQESFREALEIADLLILGRDNVVLNPLRHPF